MPPDSQAMIAPRLVNELMLVSVLVAGEGAAALAESLAQAGAAAESLAETEPGAGFDLGILLAAETDADQPGTADLVAALSRASERLLFVPLPLRLAGGAGAAPALADLTRWFEIFAELGYQPVVDFDAGFVSAGAFLVDRAATAAESELAAFADRLQNTAPAQPRDDAVQSDRAEQLELARMRAELAASEAKIATLSNQVQQTASALQQAEAQNAGWDGLRGWVALVVADPSRDAASALRRDLPRLQALRGDAAPPIEPPADAPVSRQGWLARLFRGAAKPASAPRHPVLEDAALVRASKLFDAAWYVASTPELSEGQGIDPVFHYVVVGGLRGADPGPWFDSAAYLAAHPEAEGSCPLVHAIRSGEADKLAAG